MVDGNVVAAVSEERFTREKNDVAFPRCSISWILENFNLSSEKIDLVAIVSNDVGVDYTLLKKHEWAVSDYIFENERYWKPKLYEGKDQDLMFDVMSHKICDKQYPAEYWKGKTTSSDFKNFNRSDMAKIVSEFLGVPENIIEFFDHHKSHAFYSYYMSNFAGSKVLSFTADGWGDGRNATVGIFEEDGKYEEIRSYTNCNIARVYRYMTLLLGMKPSEHEYKVMGLAPYGKQSHGQRAYEIFKSTLFVDGLDFISDVSPKDSYYYFKDRFEGIRFDNLAWALQAWVEDLLAEWVKNFVIETGVKRIVFSGGVAMNVKAMGKLMSLTEVEDIFIGGSAADESHVISALFMGARCSRKAKQQTIKRPGNLFLGPRASFASEKQAVQDAKKNAKLDVYEGEVTDRAIHALVSGKIVARSCGSMEFGQRSLGNRSILADPLKLEVKDRINEAIKNRDFWMPFAPIVLDKYAGMYLKNPKNIASPYMTLAFDTTGLGYESMRAAAHPADKTVRAQILTRDANPEVYDLLELFAKRTGRGALLNTSFNLHGYPIVNSSEDALMVFLHSDIDCLLLNNYFIEKVSR